MLQPTKRNMGITPFRAVATGVGVIVVLVFLSTIVHVILGVFAFLIEVAVIAAVAAVVFRFFQRARRG